MPEFESFDGTVISYRELGSGPLVVLLHGSIVDSSLNWDAPGLIERLTACGYRTVAVDARGHGSSAKPHDSAAYRNGALVKDVITLFEHLSAQQVALVGYSMGADTAVRVAARDARVAAVVAGGVGGDLSDPADYDPAALASSLRADSAEPRESGDEPGGALADLARSLGSDTEALAALFEGLGRQASPDLGSVTCPTLVVTGADDTMSGGDPADLAARLPCAESIVLPRLDHLGAVFHPSFAHEMIRFLERTYPSQAH